MTFKELIEFLILKLDDKNDVNTILPKDLDTQYTDDQENKLFDISPNIDVGKSKKIDNSNNYFLKISFNIKTKLTLQKQ